MSQASIAHHPSTLRILHLEDQSRDAELVAAWLEDEGFRCDITLVQTADQFSSALQSLQPDLIIADYKLPAFDGLKALRLARERFPDLPFILFSGTIGEEFAIDSLKQGATDYVLKQRPDRLIAAVRQALAATADRAKVRQAETQLRQQAALLDKAQDAIMLCDMENHITFWNRSAERIYGWTAREALGRRSEDLLSGGTSARFEAATRSVAQKGEWLGELNQVRKDGTPLIVESRWSQVRDEDETPRATLIINTDISQRKSLEAQFLRAQRVESIGALAGGIAHDLNNMLAPILMATELLGEELEPQDRKNLLVTVKSCAQRGAEMVSQILTFARGAGGQAAPLRVKPILGEMARLAKDTFPRSLQIKVQVAADLPPVFANPTQLHQVLLNLCVNARDAMPNGGTLLLTAKTVCLDAYLPQGEQQPVSGQHVVLSVSDTGVGMSNEVAARIFEPFFTTKAEGKGTGLGLATVIGIARSHNGFVELSTKLGSGTTFSVYLPAVADPDAPASAPKSAAAQMGQGEQVLVVDDELAFLEMTRETLQACNYRVLVAHDGAEALDIYRRHPGQINVVVTDMMMPIMDGPTSVQALKEIDPAVKVIGVTGLGSDAVLALAGQRSVHTLLKKPYTTPALLGALREILDERTL
jgi:two-component system cell cycle sensor histidine kinase/response regulator CckA